MRSLNSALGCTALFLLGAVSAFAADAYPSRPVRLIVPFAPGGGADFMGRLIAQDLNERDGYTLVLANNTTHVMIVATNRKPPYDPVRDFTAISMVTYAPQLLVASVRIPVKTTQELIAYAKSKPGVLNYASGGTGSQTHLAGELFRVNTQTDVRHIPFSGTGPGFTALIGGEAHFMFVSMPAAIPHIKAGRIHALSITGAKRSTLMPEMPTLGEAGVRGFEINPWFGVLGPPKLPAPIVKKLNNDLVSGLRSPETRERLASQGAEPIGSSPAEFADSIGREVAQWTQIAEKIGLRN
jgi:tripartite-type tricarboxylate transporter receptor subunit TctC